MHAEVNVHSCLMFPVDRSLILGTDQAMAGFSLILRDTAMSGLLLSHDLKEVIIRLSGEGEARTWLYH